LRAVVTAAFVNLGTTGGHGQTVAAVVPGQVIVNRDAGDVLALRFAMREPQSRLAEVTVGDRPQSH
jgi:hypothetical protein